MWASICFPDFHQQNFAGDKRNALVETWFKGKDYWENMIDI